LRTGVGAGRLRARMATIFASNKSINCIVVGGGAHVFCMSGRGIKGFLKN
jgi:hypothetical protein